jgi:hypothetical protein
MEEEKNRSSCKWYIKSTKGDWICSNFESEYLCDYVSDDHTCVDYEER